MLQSDFDFISRLCEEEGIFYFFEHQKGRHTLVFADAAGKVVIDPSPQLVPGIDAADDVPSFLRQAAAVAADTEPAPYSSPVAVDMKRNLDGTAADLLCCGTYYYERHWGARPGISAGHV